MSNEFHYNKIQHVVEKGHGSDQLGEPTSPNKIGLRGHSFRTPTHRQETYAAEGMMNEAAAAAKADPIEYRLRHTTNQRLITVLDTLRKEHGWKTRPSPKPDAKATGSGTVTGQGMFVFARFNAWWAAATDISVNLKTGKIKVVKYTGVVEPGLVVNPRQMRLNYEGGTVQGISEALFERTTFDRGKVTSVDWVTYPILRIVEMPDVNVVLINNPSVGTYNGAGEGSNGLPYVAIPAALHDATGKFPRRCRSGRRTCGLSWPAEARDHRTHADWARRRAQSLRSGIYSVVARGRLAAGLAALGLFTVLAGSAGSHVRPSEPSATDGSRVELPVGENIRALSSLRLPSTGDLAFFDHGGRTGKHVYVGATTTNDGGCPSGVRVVDVGDPRRPRLVATAGGIAGVVYEDVEVRRIGSRIVLAVGLQPCRRTRGGGNAGLALYDVTKPSRPESGSRPGRARGAGCTSSTSSSGPTAGRWRSSRRRTPSGTRWTSTATSAATGASSTSPIPAGRGR